MSKTPAKPAKRQFHPAMLLLPACAVLGLAAWSAGASPAAVSVLSLGNTPTSTHAQSFAQMLIPKPTYTSQPVSVVLPASTIPSVQPELPTSLPTEMPTSTLEPTVESGVIYAEIVPDTPMPEYVAPAAQPYAGADTSTIGYGGNKYILVDISEQHMYVYDGDMLVFSFVASTGMRNATRVGNFSVLDKIPNAYGATWNIWMPNWLGIYWAGGLENGIHALPILPNGAQLWAGYLGTPISYGCVVLGAYESQLLYDWAEIGTPVEIRW